MGFRDFIDSLAFGLLVIGIFVAVFAIPIAVAYLVFSIVSSPDVNSVIRGAVFALYTIGVFMIGVFIIGSAYESNRKDIIKLIGMCEDKVASISRDVRHCSSSAESKAYDVMTCLKAIEEKI
jgi:hypothetical protein